MPGDLQETPVEFHHAGNRIWFLWREWTRRDNNYKSWQTGARTKGAV